MGAEEEAASSLVRRFVVFDYSDRERMTLTANEQYELGPPAAKHFRCSRDIHVRVGNSYRDLLHADFAFFYMSLDLFTGLLNSSLLYTVDKPHYTVLYSDQVSEVVHPPVHLLPFPPW